jgi:putative addiction module killer protein
VFPYPPVVLVLSISYTVAMSAAQPYTIDMYVTRTGSVPFEEWLVRLRDARARARIRVRIDRLSLGNPGDVRSAGGGVWELRIDYGPGYRVYYAQSNTTTLLLLCGGDKTTQAVDIRQAQASWAEYQQRRRHEPPDQKLP